MMLKYLRRSFRSRMGEALIAVLTVVLCLTLLLLLDRILADQQRELDSVYDNTKIVCTVSDPTGFSVDGLSVPSVYLDFFTEGGSLFDDVTDVRCYALASFLLLNEEDRIPFYMMNTPEAVPLFDSLSVTYTEGYGPADFEGEEAIAIISDSLLPYVGEDGMMTLYLPPRMEDSITFRVVGTCALDSKTVYISLKSGWDLMARNNRSFFVRGMSFTVIDNRRLNEIKTSLSNYFIPANRFNSGKARWGLIMDDASFVDSVMVVERSIALFRLFQTVLFLLAAGVCFLVSFLLIRRRRAELAVMRSLGCGGRQIYGQLLMEYALCFALGVLLSLTALRLGGFVSEGISWSTVGMLLICWMVSTAVSTAIVTSGDVMKILKGKE